MKGYKAFNKELQCRGFQYSIGETYEFDGEPILCTRGFHFCKSIADCYNFYPMSDETRICEVEASGCIVTEDKIKYCTNKIMIIREITEEWQRRGNANVYNTGYCNTGNMNSGNWNTGTDNAGNKNAGYSNTGDKNVGHNNTGDRNIGSWNAGNANVGNNNTGCYNVGWFNAGNWNTGNYNTGNYNTGDNNIGCYNAGDWNTGDYNTGIFCTETHNILAFDMETDWNFLDWLQSDAKRLLSRIPKNEVEWISVVDMTAEEKEQNPTYETVGGYLKELDQSEAAQIWWDELTDKEKEVIYSLPNFDMKKFKKCVGIK